MILLEDVSRRWEDQILVQNINWEMKQDENWVLFGLNGSGKTSLLNIITGYLWPSTGKVTVLGKEFGNDSIPELRKKIGFVSSSLDEFMPDYDYAENIVLSGRHAWFGLHDDPTQAEIDFALELMERFNCNNLIHRTYETLSQGEKQKVMIMRALMAEPALLILDEPCNGLDVIAREQVLELINSIRNDPGAPQLLYVTHHVEEILPVFSHVLLLRDGEIFAKGPINDLITEQVISDFLKRDVKIDKLDERNYLRIGSLKK